MLGSLPGPRFKIDTKSLLFEGCLFVVGNTSAHGFSIDFCRCCYFVSFTRPAMELMDGFSFSPLFEEKRFRR